MTVATWSFVDLATGEFTGALLRGGLQIGLFERPGLLAVLGDYAPQEYRYDLAERKVVKRAEPLAEPEDAGAAVLETHADLRALDTQSVRALRELVLALSQGQAPPQQALQRLLQADQGAAASRAQLPPQ
jgi:hypothetical protein